MIFEKIHIGKGEENAFFSLKIHSLKNKSNFQKKQKIYQFLSYKGFDYDTIMSAWSKLQENADV